MRLNKIFFKEILLVIRNFCIAMSEIELVFRRAERRCSGSLFSMLLFKKLYWMQIFKINCLATTLYEVFNRLQAFLFFSPFLGNKRGNQKKTHVTLLGGRSE